MRFVALAAALLAALPVLAEEKTNSPWRINDYIGLENVTVDGQIRARYESLDHQFRSGGSGGDQIVVYRSSIRAKWQYDAWSLTGEILDARQQLADDGTTLNVGIVNTTEIVQAHVGYSLHDFLEPGSTTRLQLGRQVMDIGSRRLVAHTRFRNTTNGFLGANALWEGEKGTKAQLFYMLPLERLPDERDDLEDNDYAYDRAHSSVQFSGVYWESPKLFSGLTTSISLFHLDEDDNSRLPTANRDLYTVGISLQRKPQLRNVDFEVESFYQVGSSRATKNTADTNTLTHRAHFQHAQVGYSFDAAWKPRLLLQFDYASGDRNPADSENNRFDTLYGARRFDFGPTGIYGSFARSNIISPGYRLILKPKKSVKLMVAHRYFALASKKDAWTTAKLRDSSGHSSRDLGHQVEIKATWDAIPGNLSLEAGAAKLFGGQFQDDLLGSGRDSTYSYLQATFKF